MRDKHVVCVYRTGTADRPVCDVALPRVSGLSDHPIGTARWALIRSRVLVPLLIVKGKQYLGIPYRVTHDATRLMLPLTHASSRLRP